MHFNQCDIANISYYTEKTAELIDEEAKKLVRKAYDDTLNLLTEYKDKVKALAESLLEKETIGHEDIVEVLGERPFQNDAYKAYLANTKEWEAKYQEDVIDGTVEHPPTTEIKDEDGNVVEDVVANENEENNKVDDDKNENTENDNNKEQKEEKQS